jgi:Zn-dependent metalloprotease
LAAALGIGIALATTPGMATAAPDADTTTTQPATTAAAKSPSTDTESADAAGASPAEPASEPLSALTVANPQGSSAPGGGSAVPDTPAATAATGLPPVSVTQVDSGLAPDAGGVVATGGAQTGSRTRAKADPTASVDAVTISPADTGSTDIVAALKGSQRSAVQGLTASTGVAAPVSTWSAGAPSGLSATGTPAPALRVVESAAVSSIAVVAPSPIPVGALSGPVDPVTAFVAPVVSLAAGLLSLIGLAPAVAANPLAPVDPPVMWALLAYVRRQFEQTLFNQSPLIGFGPITTSQSDTGVITGTVPIGDPDGDPLGVAVVAGPAHGVVSVDPISGAFAYTPNSALAGTGGTDTFSVAVAELNSAGHVHGPAGLLAAVLGGARGDTVMATVTVTVAPVNGFETAALNTLVADGKVAVVRNKDGTVRVIDGTFTDTVVGNRADAAGLMNRVAGLLGASAGFADEAHVTDQVLGDPATGRPVEVVYRLGASAGGVPALTSQVVVVTDGTGTVTSVFSSYNSKIEAVDTTPSNGLAGESEAVAAAIAAALSSVADTQEPATVSALLASLTVQSDLVIYDVNPDVAPTLARRIKIFSPVTPSAEAALPTIGATYYVHANGVSAGAVFAAFSDLHEADSAFVSVTPTAYDLLGKPRPVTVDYQQSSGLYRYIDWPRLLGTFASSSTSQVPGALVYGQVGGSIDASAVSAQANTEVVYDFYRYTLGRASYDGQGRAIYITILPNTYNNAYYSRSQGLVFGHDTEAALDVVGHEFTHGIVDFAVGGGNGLVYSGESGAINEAYADIMGSLIEGKTGAARWLIGEDYGCGSAAGCALRDLSQPSRFGDPENYANRYTGTADYGGVHTNSLIFSFAAYKMMTDARTNGVSSATWARVFYNSLFRLSSNARFTDGRAAVISAASALGFTAAQQQAVTDAFNAVGIA